MQVVSGLVASAGRVCGGDALPGKNSNADVMGDALHRTVFYCTVLTVCSSCGYAPSI